MVTNTQIGTTNTVIYNVPAGESHAVVLMILCNTDDVNDKTVTVYAVPSGGSPGNNNMILNDVLIPSGDTRIFNLEKFIMMDGDQIVAIADDSGVTATFSVMPL